MPHQDDTHSALPHELSASLSKWGVRLIAHGAGVLCVAALMLVAFINETALDAIVASSQQAEFLRMSWVDAALHLGLSACLWTLAVIGFQLVTARPTPVHHVLRLERGSVMTETLMVFPVFLLLTFGIAQLAVNNIAGLLTNTAVFQAGRTAWLWSAEAEVSRRGVDTSLVKEMAHVQAAAVLTPVAPGAFMQMSTSATPQFKEMRGILLGSQVPAFSTDTGQTAMSLAPVLLLGDNMTSTTFRDSSFAAALDTASWRRRTVRKFTFAYQATKIRVINGNEVGVELTYFHNEAFPLVGAIFGDPHTDIGGRPGYYTEITRQFTMPKQIPPNKKMP